MIRQPAVAGRFYPDDPEELARQVADLCNREGVPPRRQATACIVPHAGYIYSGHVAAAVYARLMLPTRFVLLGPRHYPKGQAQAILSEGTWQTPLGRAEIDSELATKLQTACPALTEDEVAHRQEHALEVQLPFLQCLASDFRFVPIALGTIDYLALETLGQALAEVVQGEASEILIVASSDMNHYESDTVTRTKDRAALERVLALDARGLLDTVRSQGITMCGVGPTVSALVASRALGAARAEIVRYATSGDINGDRNEVVGYAGVIID